MVKTNTIIKELIENGYKITKINPATPNTDTEILLENGFSIQCGNEGLCLVKELKDGSFQFYGVRNSNKDLLNDLKTSFKSV